MANISKFPNVMNAIGSTWILRKNGRGVKTKCRYQKKSALLNIKLSEIFEKSKLASPCVCHFGDVHWFGSAKSFFNTSVSKKFILRRKLMVVFWRGNCLPRTWRFGIVPGRTNPGRHYQGSKPIFNHIVNDFMTFYQYFLRTFVINWTLFMTLSFFII